MDRAVSAELLTAIRPLGVEAALDAWDRHQASDRQKQQAIEMALEKARYQANRIQRQFEAVHPANRLVAGELERRCNEALQKVGGLETGLTMMREAQIALTEDDRQQLMTLGRDLDLVWDHPHCSVHLKKRILRMVVREIIVSEDDGASCILMTVHWFGGGHTHLEANRRTQPSTITATPEKSLLSLRNSPQYV